MVSTRTEAVSFVCTRKDVATQMECPPKHTAIQVLGCKEFQSLALLSEGNRENSCVGCNQVNNLFSPVAELRDVERLRSIRDSEEIDQWSHTLPCLRQTTCHLLHKKQYISYPLPTRKKEGTVEMEGCRNGFLLRVAGKSPPDLLHLPRCSYPIVMKPGI